MSAKGEPRFLEPCAALASLALAALFFLPRLPHGAELILPRRPLYGLFAPAFERRRLLAASASAALWLAMLVAAGFLGRWLKRRWPELRPHARRAAGVLVGLVLAERLAHLFVFGALDLVQNAWFFPESLDWREPLLTWLVFAFAAVLLARITRRLLAWSAGDANARAAALPATVLLAAALGVRGWAVLSCDAGRRNAAEAAGLAEGSQETRVFVVFAQKDGRPETEVHRIGLGEPFGAGLSRESLSALESYAGGRRTVYTPAALSTLYAAGTVAMEPQALRRALRLGLSAGDPVSRLLLLEHLAAASPDPSALAALDELSDERRFRVGAMAAAELAQAWARQGQANKAAAWRVKSGIPEGLLSRASEGPLKPGMIAGRIAGAKVPAWVALYVHPDPAASYTLAAAQLADATTAGASGRFEFKGLAAGDYFLAVRLDYSGEGPYDVTARGPGDIRLSPERPRIELAPIALTEK